ncbi:C-C chemokine receptor type 5-like [Saccostrea echinata]|uniref:C-C chemokine receptor type 5-like n=1 Tax=Saccostrea echinata TaxID=191078 RepID=UPI002A824E8D|nr:C-C chemokine receptor type 5-like [Saccostrea echinata]XP_061179200.1 C-C chemokine receptor type 5-like [Saccostrea echinata]
MEMSNFTLNLTLNVSTNTTDHNFNQDLLLNGSTQFLKFFTWEDYDSLSLRWLAMSTLIIGAFGLTGNFIAFVKIVFSKKLHTPTFAAIGCLALPDLFMIIHCYIISFTNIESYLRDKFYFDQHLVSVCDFYDSLFYMTYYCSLGHVIFLSIVRYLLITDPLRSKNYLTVSFVARYSIIIWCISFILSISTVALFMVDMNLTKDESYLILAILRAIVGFIPICIIIILHYLKLKTLRNSTVNGHVQNRMSFIVVVILSVFTSYQIFVIFKPILWVLDLKFNIAKSVQNTFYSVSQLFAFLHFSCNPYIYFFISVFVSNPKRELSTRHYAINGNLDKSIDV